MKQLLVEVGLQPLRLDSKARSCRGLSVVSLMVLLQALYFEITLDLQKNLKIVQSSHVPFTGLPLMLLHNHIILTQLRN